MELAWQLNAVLIFSALIIIILLGTPISFSLGILSLAGLLLFFGMDRMAAFGSIPWTTLNIFVFAAVPLFFLMSEIITFTGMSSDIFDAMRKWLNWLPGGLAIVSVVTCTIFGAVSSTGVGVAAIVGKIAVPEMLKYNYERKLALGSLAASSSLGMLIPPSIPLIVYGMVTEQSVGRLFMAGILPGLLVAALYSVYIITRVVLKPALAPPTPGGFTLKEQLLSLRKIWPIATLIVLVLGGMYAGVYTPTEAAAIGVVGSVIIAALYRRLTWYNLRNAITSATKTTSMMMLIVVGAMLFGYMITNLGIAQSLSEWIVGLGINRWVAFAMMNMIWLVLGCFLEVSSIILITIPVLYPVTIALGFDPIWLGVVLIVNMCAAVVTPPVGLCSYVVHSVVPDIPISEIFRGVVPFFFLVIIAIIILSIFPEIVMVLPNMMYGM
ncbi:MAG: TRAP transporter large permease subunit [Dehalococcoidales bacterium]|nr:TRAP transporter large permease subunit [Dehalococcoidales bacterium]